MLLSNNSNADLERQKRIQLREQEKLLRQKGVENSLYNNQQELKYIQNDSKVVDFSQNKDNFYKHLDIQNGNNLKQQENIQNINKNSEKFPYYQDVIQIQSDQLNSSYMDEGTLGKQLQNTKEQYPNNFPTNDFKHSNVDLLPQNIQKTEQQLQNNQKQFNKKQQMADEVLKELMQKERENQIQQTKKQISQQIVTQLKQDQLKQQVQKRQNNFQDQQLKDNYTSKPKLNLTPEKKQMADDVFKELMQKERENQILQTKSNYINQQYYEQPIQQEQKQQPQLQQQVYRQNNFEDQQDNYLSNPKQNLTPQKILANEQRKKMYEKSDEKPMNFNDIEKKRKFKEELDKQIQLRERQRIMEEKKIEEKLNKFQNPQKNYQSIESNENEVIYNDDPKLKQLQIKKKYEEDLKKQIDENQKKKEIQKQRQIEEDLKLEQSVKYAQQKDQLEHQKRKNHLINESMKKDNSQQSRIDTQQNDYQSNVSMYQNTPKNQSVSNANIQNISYSSNQLPNRNLFPVMQQQYQNQFQQFPFNQQYQLPCNNQNQYNQFPFNQQYQLPINNFNQYHQFLLNQQYQQQQQNQKQMMDYRLKMHEVELSCQTIINDIKKNTTSIKSNIDIEYEIIKLHEKYYLQGYNFDKQQITSIFLNTLKNFDSGIPQNQNVFNNQSGFNNFDTEKALPCDSQLIYDQEIITDQNQSYIKDQIECNNIQQKLQYQDQQQDNKYIINDDHLKQFYFQQTEPNLDVSCVTQLSQNKTFVTQQSQNKQQSLHENSPNNDQKQYYNTPKSPNNESNNNQILPKSPLRSPKESFRSPKTATQITEVEEDNISEIQEEENNNIKFQSDNKHQQEGEIQLQQAQFNFEEKSIIFPSDDLSEDEIQKFVQSPKYNDIYKNIKQEHQLDQVQTLTQKFNQTPVKVKQSSKKSSHEKEKTNSGKKNVPKSQEILNRLDQFIMEIEQNDIKYQQKQKSAIKNTQQLSEQNLEIFQNLETQNIFHKLPKILTQECMQQQDKSNYKQSDKYLFQQNDEPDEEVFKQQLVEEQQIENQNDELDNLYDNFLDDEDNGDYDCSKYMEVDDDENNQ